MAPCPVGAQPYIIKRGDTLYNLANRFDTTVPAIISANPSINPRMLMISQVICVPMRNGYGPCPRENYYTIKWGDTLDKISEFFNISLDDLLEANPRLDPDRVVVGQVICIPLAIPPVTCPENTERYIIKSGDTFYSLASRFGVSIESIEVLNPGVNPDALLIGQPICIPLETIDVRLYYGNIDNSELVYTVKTIPYTTDEDKYLKTLNALIKGPYDDNMNFTIDKATRILSITVEDGIANINLSRDFLNFAGTLDEVIAVRSIVETIMQFEEIQGVRLFIEGEDLIGPSGMPYGVLQ